MKELEYRYSIRFATHGAKKALMNKDMPRKFIDGIPSIKE